MVKLNKIEKAEKLRLGSRMSLIFVVSAVQRQKLTANGLDKPKQKV